MMYRKTYSIWQVSAVALLANASQKADGRYHVVFNFEKAQHNPGVRRTEQPQCALFDQMEQVLWEPAVKEQVGSLLNLEWHIVYVDFAGIFDRKPIGKTAELQKKAESMFRPEGIQLVFPYSRWRYYAFERSASMSRASRLTFVSEFVYERLKERITLGMRFDRCVLSKVYAYNGLMFTDGFRFGACFDPERVIVVDDFQSTVRDVPMITVEDVGGDGAVRTYRRIETTGEVTVKEFDGEGLISLELSQRIDYMYCGQNIHSSFQIRMPYIKGVVHMVDFHALFRELKVPYLIDVWGNRHNVENVDLILTKSMFKAFGWMTDNGMTWEAYLKRCEQYGHALYVSQVNPVKPKPYVDMNYQFLATVSMTYDEFRPHDLPDGWESDPMEDDRHWITKESEAEYYHLAADPKSRLEYFTANLDDPEIQSFSKEAAFAKLLQRNPLFIHESVYTDELNRRAESVRQNYGMGRMLILGENRYLSGDLMRFLYRLTELTAQTKKTCKRALKRLGAECLHGTTVYAPGIAFPYTDTITLLRNPHIARNEEAVVGLLAEGGLLREKYFSHLTFVVMVDARTLVPERLGGADYDGDIVKLIADPLLNTCVQRNYAERDLTLYDYRRNLPLLKIPSVSAKESDASDWHARFVTVRDTFSSRIGQICNAAFNRAVIAYDEAIDEKERSHYREETELLAILTGLEIDAAKNGVKPDVSKYLEDKKVERSLFLDYKDIVTGKRGGKRKGNRLNRYFHEILWTNVTSNIERLPYLADRLKRQTHRIKPAPAEDRELFAFAEDASWKDRLPADVLQYMRRLIDDYETALRRIRTERLNLNYMTRKKDVERILFARAQTDVSVESLYAMFVDSTAEEFQKARAAMREEKWHLIQEPFQRGTFPYRFFRTLSFIEAIPILTDFRCGGYRILGDIICDYDDFYQKRGNTQARLRREDDSEDLHAMLEGEDLIYRTNYKAEIEYRCRTQMDEHMDRNMALRCAIALGERKFALEVLTNAVYENATVRAEQ